MGRLVEKAEIVAGADERTAIAGQRDHRQGTEHLKGAIIRVAVHAACL
jgi:hypothetical protein